jgi:DNA-binding MarR family transcriptional regulator
VQTFLMMDLLRAFYWFDEALQAGLKQKGWSDITRSQSLILSNIAFGVRRASVLARNLGVTRQAISQMLSEMERKGLIQMTADPSDGRAQVVGFGPESKSIRHDAMSVLGQLQQELSNKLGRKRFAALTEALAADWGPPLFVGDKA